MKWRTENIYVAIVAIILSLPFLWVYLFFTDESADHEINIILSEVRHREAEVEVYLLKSRSHIDNNFDALTKAQNNMKSIMITFNRYINQLEGKEKQQATVIAALYEKRMEQVEKFKTLHAKLSNSLRFLPKLNQKINDVYNQGQSGYSHNIIDVSGVILTSALNLRLFGDDDMLIKAHQNITHLTSLIADKADNNLTELLTAFIQHTEMFLRLRTIEAGIVAALVNNEFEGELSTLEQQMVNRYLLEDRAKTQVRKYLTAYSALLFFVILLFILNRSHLLKRVSRHQRLSEKDSLTGLSNRRHFLQKLEQALKNSVKDNVYGAIIFIDLDGFKAVNDTLGHNAGDEVLRMVSTRLANQSAINAESGMQQFVARLGGDEFVILHEGLTQDNLIPTLTTAAQQILKLCSRSFGPIYDDVPITASLGIVTFPEYSKDVTELLHFADLAMYQSKKQGKNRFQFYRFS